MKVLIEDPDLAKNIRDYLGVHGTDVADDAAIHVQLPGAGKAPRECGCGCGAMTSGGRFVPGHDAKLKSALFSIVRGTPDKVPAEIQVNGPMGKPTDQWTPEEAQHVLDVNEWGKPAPKKAKAPKPEKVEGESASNGDGEGGEVKSRARGTTKKDREKVREEAAANA